MEEVLAALKEILEEAAEQGGDLAHVIINNQENKLPEAAEEAGAIMLTIGEDEEVFGAKSDWDYELVDGYIYLAVITAVAKREKNNWRLAKARIKPVVKMVRKVILGNPALLSNSYPQGIIYDGQLTKFNNVKYGYQTAGTQWHVYARLRLQVQYIYRKGVISIE